MFTSLTIENFRGFHNFYLERLSSVNLIMGANNVGKSALLEAVFLLLGESNLGLVPRLNANRGLEKYQGRPEEMGEWLWTSLFFNLDTRLTIRIKAQNSGVFQRELELMVVPRSSAPVNLASPVSGSSQAPGRTVSAHALQVRYSDARGTARTAQLFVDAQEGLRIEPPAPLPKIPGFLLPARRGGLLEEDAKLLGDLIVLKQPYDLMSALRVIEPKLTGLTPIPSPSGTVVYGDIGLGQMLPLALMGDGMGRLASILLRIASAPGGVVLVDEIENGFHHSNLVNVWGAIAEAAERFGTQVIATTHSLENVRAAHEAFAGRAAYNLSLHRFDRVGEEIVPVTYSRDTILASLEMNLEIR